ncbi:hypothetical protein ACIO93_30505 [Streptomyces sp. NPDC087903]|uniref:hypothetical protein n=1 Tax=Streptomyces sp. NPDC087903 TaxID=3365819 RepID=UPI00382890B0
MAHRALTTHAAALTATAALLLTACGGSDEPNAADGGASPSAAPEGAVTRAQAAKILDTYGTVNSKANTTQDAKLLSTVEGGQVHEQSKADYTTFDTWTKADQSDYKKPFSYQAREYYIPVGEDWFAVKATASGSKNPALLVFDKEGSTWKMVSAVYSDAPIPAIDTGNHGLATAVAPSTRVGAMAPNDVSAAFEDLFETGGKKAGAALSSSTGAAKDALKLYKDRTKGDTARWATRKYFAKAPAHKETYALRLTDGGVLAVVPTAHTKETLLKPQYMSSFQITPNDEESAYNPDKRALITDTFQGMALATLPPTGKPSVIADEYRMTDSK